jgi:pSer/pThr/pTyr-binding forkhead associated (FHA) protein
MPTLRIKLPNDKGEMTHILSGDRITVGRRPDNTVQIIDRTVSGYHAELIGYHGQYRLRDLGSTNLTSVNGKQVTEHQLNEACKVTFGSVECEFSLETPAPEATESVNTAPSKSEMEFIRRENLDLQAKIAAQQKQIDILNSARLITKETQQLAVSTEAHRRVVAERDELKKDNEQLRLEVEHLRADVLAIRRDRDATRQAWETVKTELAAAQQELAGRQPASAPSYGRLEEALSGAGESGSPANASATQKLDPAPAGFAS